MTQSGTTEDNLQYLQLTYQPIPIVWITATAPTATANTGVIILIADSSSRHGYWPAEDIGSLFLKLCEIPSGDTIGRDRNAIRDPRPRTLKQCRQRLVGGKNGRSGGKVNGRVNRACVAGRTRDSWGGTW